ncbi:MAG: DnaJ domain-containing protein [Alphaproteobacteria bacterium]|nr:DnaJ domain-containing protein [Alphaproteobacteria bacterium]
MRNPYAVLGVSKTASGQDIKSAFRRQAKACHPDRNQHDPEASVLFGEISAAYEILGDEEKRQMFDGGLIDATGRKRKRKSVFQGFASSVSGFGFNRRSPNKPAAERTAERTTEPRDRFANGTHDEIMEHIFGQSFVRDTVDESPGIDDVPGAEPAQEQPIAEGDVMVDLAVPLEAALRVAPFDVPLPNGKTVPLKLPTGIENGRVVRLAGEGEKRADGQMGDAIISIRFAAHKTLRIDGVHLVHDLPVQLSDGIAGTKLPVETLDGKILVAVPPWSGSDRVLRVAGKGLPDHEGKRGDLLVNIRLLLPENPVEELIAFARSNA